MQFSKIRTKIHVLVIALFILPAIPMAANALPAFPGAMGWGSDTIGGRGGTVIKVTNLNDSGSGSLRAALTASGPRIVIFRVGGTINLSSPIWVGNPYLTIAGQTAPGGGILIRGPNQQGGDGHPSIAIQTHDVIIRGLRIRDTGKSTIEVLGPSTNTYNVIIDHNSLSWSTDTITGNWGLWHHVTWSYNIISEGIYNDIGQSWGLSAGTLNGIGGACTGADHLSMHHNLYIHNNERNLHINHPIPYFEWINNVVFDWRQYGLGSASPGYYVGNLYVATSGSMTNYDFFIGELGEGCPFPDASVYLAHNVNPHRPTDSGDEWLAVNGGSGSYRTNIPPYSLSGVTEDDVTTIKSKLTASNGAGAYVPSRDAVDVRVINDVINGTPADGSGNGWWFRDYNMPSPWPTIASGTAPTDTDGDGMPNSWENSHGLNPNDASDANAIAASGYTNIEEYINSYFPAIGSPLPPPSALIPNPPSIIGVN